MSSTGRERPASTNGSEGNWLAVRAENIGLARRAANPCVVVAPGEMRHVIAPMPRAVAGGEVLQIRDGS
jgi:hypothetical protein